MNLDSRGKPTIASLRAAKLTRECRQRVTILRFLGAFYVGYNAQGQRRSPEYPCEHGHFECSYREGGPCCDETMAAAIGATGLTPNEVDDVLDEAHAEVPRPTGYLYLRSN